MEKLLELVKKVRESVIPPEEIKKMNKKNLLLFFEEAKILEKMQTFHDKRKAKALKSIVHEVDEESVVPDLADLKKMPVSKIRKLLREFHRDIGLKAKHAKMSASKLRSFVSRNKYQEILYGDDDMKFLSTMDEGKEKKPKSKGKDRARSRSPRKTPSTQPVVNVYTGEYSGEKGEEKCDCECEMPNILEEQDTQGIIMKLAPELYRSLLAKSYLLDLCNLNRMKREQEVCAVACDPKAYNRWACCEKPQCCPEVAAVAVPSKGMVEVREGGKLGDIGVFDDKDEVGIGGRTPGPRLYGTRQKSSGQLPGGTPTPPYRRRGPYTRGTGPGPTLGRGGGRGSGPGHLLQELDPAREYIPEVVVAVVVELDQDQDIPPYRISSMRVQHKALDLMLSQPKLTTS